MLKEFREFISRGNVIDLAVGVIIGAAFGKIVTTLVEGVIMPPIGLVLGQIDFSSLFFVLERRQRHPRLTRRSQGQGHSGDRLRSVHQRNRRLRDRRARGLHVDQAGQPAEAAGARRCADDEGLPVLSVGDSAESDALPALHVADLRGPSGSRKAAPTSRPARRARRRAPAADGRTPSPARRCAPSARTASRATSAMPARRVTMIVSRPRK